MTHRREFLKAAMAAAPLLSGRLAAATEAAQKVRKVRIPGHNEMLPMIGLGTWQTFDVAPASAQQAELKLVLAELIAQGASVVDSSPMYGRSEAVVGNLAAQLDIHQKLFKATKVWTSGKQAGIAQMQASMAKMKTDVIDLMQVHNLVDAKTHLRTLVEWKQQGLIRYIGLTHYHSGGYAEMLRLMQRPEIDFIQINYSIISREAEAELFEMAQERDIAVMVNRPYESGQLFRAVKGLELPAFSAEFDCQSWGQFFLKFIISHPAVTCVIPGTSKLKHLRDNLQAGHGRLPSPSQRRAMSAFMRDL